MDRRKLTLDEEAWRQNLRRIYSEKKKELGLTQEKLADLGEWKSQGTISNYFNGIIPLNTDAKLKFASILQVDVTEIDPTFRTPNKAVSSAEEFVDRYGDSIRALSKEEQLRVVSKLVEKIAQFDTSDDSKA